MNKSLLIVFLLFVSFFNASLAQAHLLGQPPFFKINGVYTDIYSVMSTSLPDFDLPQDIATGTYLVNTPINFEMELNILPISAEIIEQSKFSWDFGDGTTGEGTKNTHIYKKPGSYILEVNVSAAGQEPQLLQTTLIHILPSSDYKLPRASFTVNGWKPSGDPTVDMLNTKFEEEFSFDGSGSSGGDSKITEAKWDFGDGVEGKGLVTKHTYTSQPYAVMPVLRIKTEDGFISDSFVQMKEGAIANPLGYLGEKASNPTLGGLSLTEKLFVGVVILVLIYGGYFVLAKILRRR